MDQLSRRKFITGATALAVVPMPASVPAVIPKDNLVNKNTIQPYFYISPDFMDAFVYAMQSSVTFGTGFVYIDSKLQTRNTL